MMLPDLPKLDTVAILCIPQKKIFIHRKKDEKYVDEPFKEWDLRKFEELPEDSQFISQYPEIRVKETIPPENIIGCIDIIKKNNEIHNIYNIKDWDAPNRFRYMINKECKF